LNPLFIKYSVLTAFRIGLKKGQILKIEFVRNVGHIKFQVNGSVRIFKIISDGIESLTLRTTGLWPYANIGPNQLVTLQLTRIGP
jgi:hypothetical protein